MAYFLNKWRVNALNRTSQLQIAGHMKQSALRRAVANFKKCGGSETARALALWKLFALKARGDKLADSLAKKTKIVEGAEKMENLRRKRPRKALRSVNKNMHNRRLQDNEVKKLRLMFLAGLHRSFDLWKNKASMYTHTKDMIARAGKGMDTSALKALSLKLIRKPLREFFDRVKAKEAMPQKVKRAVAAGQRQHNDKIRDAFNLWKRNGLSNSLGNVIEKLRQSKDKLSKDADACIAANLL